MGQSSELAVSLLRLSIVQLEVAHNVVRDKGLMEAACGKRREAEKEDRDTGRTDSRIQVSFRIQGLKMPPSMQRKWTCVERAETVWCMQPGTLAEVDRQVLLLQLQDKLLQARCMLLEVPCHHNTTT